MFGIKQIPSLFRIAATTDAGLGLPTWSITGQLPLRRGAESAAASEQCECGLALSGDAAVYNEEAFRYLLDIERKRFEASSQPFVLVLVDLVHRLGHTDRMPVVTAGRIFATLTQTLRDTDVIGWYREGRVIGAVLTHLGEAPLADSTRLLSARVSKALSDDLPEEISRQIKVRLFRPRAGMTP